MTTECRYFCDRCRVRITEGRVMLAIQLPTQRDFTDADLCEPCGRALTSWLAAGPALPARAPGAERTI